MRGEKHGQGRLTLGDGGFYEGEFTQGEMTGIGYRVFADGRSYSGTFERGEMHGSGTLMLANGTLVEGNFIAGILHGQDCSHQQPDGSAYRGAIVMGKRHGRGTQQYVAAVPVAVAAQDVMTDGNHSIVSGENENQHINHGDGNKTGYWGGEGGGGGEYYEGEWAEDREHGRGILVTGVSGLRYTGRWEYGKLVEGSCLHSVHGVVYVGPFGVDRHMCNASTHLKLLNFEYGSGFIPNPDGEAAMVSDIATETTTKDGSESGLSNKAATNSATGYATIGTAAPSDNSSPMCLASNKPFKLTLRSVRVDDPSDGIKDIVDIDRTHVRTCPNEAGREVTLTAARKLPLMSSPTAKESTINDTKSGVEQITKDENAVSAPSVYENPTPKSTSALVFYDARGRKVPALRARSSHGELQILGSCAEWPPGQYVFTFNESVDASLPFAPLTWSPLTLSVDIVQSITM